MLKNFFINYVTFPFISMYWYKKLDDELLVYWYYKFYKILILVDELLVQYILMLSIVS